MNVFSENGLSSYVVQALLTYLNKATAPEEIQGESDLALPVAEELINQRDLLGGQYTQLSQLETVSGVTTTVVLQLIELATSYIKQTVPKELFSFVQIKTPDPLLGEGKRKYRFVNAPADSGSELLGAIKNTTDADERFVKIADWVKSYKGYTNLPDFRKEYGQMLEFCIWLKANRSQLDYDATRIAIANMTNLSVVKQKNLWDNLFFQTLTDNAPTLREAMIRVIQANNFYLEFKNYVTGNQDESFEEGDQLFFQNLAKASVIIPSKIVSRKSLKKEDPAEDTLDTESNTFITNKTLQAAQQQYIHLLHQGSEHLTHVERGYQRLVSDERKIALEAYNQQIETLKQNAAVTDPNTGETTYPGLVIPPFVFQPSISESSFLENEMLPAGLGVFSFLVETEIIRESSVTYNNLRETLNTRIAKAYDKLDTIPVPKKQILVMNGSKTPINNEPLTDCLSYSLQQIPFGEDNYSLFVTQYFKNTSDRIFKLDGILQLSTGDTFQSASEEPVSTSDHFVTFQLFPDGAQIQNLNTISRIDLQYSIDETQDIVSFTNPNKLKPGLVNTMRFVPVPTDTSFSKLLDGEPGSNTHPMYGVSKIGVGEFKRVEQEISCYVEGEVSHIENVMAREYKERATRNTIRSEYTTEVTTEREVENTTDTTTTDRYELQKEVSLILDEQKSTQLGASASVNGNYPSGISFSASANMGYSTSASSSSSQSEAETYAKEVTQQATKRVLDRVSRKRTSKIVREFEETNKHGYDNREGTDHVTGIYRWIDKIYDNRLMNYGKRLMYEFMIPEPARNYKSMMTKAAATTDNAFVLTPPKSLADFGVNSRSDIHQWTYYRVAGHFGLDVDSYPQELLTISKSFAEDTQKEGPDEEAEGAWQYDVEIPDGYECFKFNYKWHNIKHDGGESYYLQTLMIGRKDFTLAGLGGTNNVYITPVEKELPVSFTAENISVLAGNITLKCRRTQAAYKHWQEQTYILFMQAYQEQLAIYNEAMQAATVVPSPVDQVQAINYNNNPILNRAIEKRELKRLAIELMIGAFFNPVTGRDNYMYYSPKDNYKVKANSVFEWHAGLVKFLEQAVDWEIMAYTLFPYYWANETDWSKILKSTSQSDLIFEAFLQSGMANVVVPVRLGFEKRFMYFLDTGQVITSEDLVTDGDDEAYLALDALLEVPEDPKPEAEWKTVVPTSLTIIQAYSAPLNANGLPCKAGRPVGVGFSRLERKQD